MDTELERELEKAQAALLAHYAPDTRVRRVRCSQGETQLLELGDGPPLLLVHGGGDGAFEWVPILSALARNRRVLAVDRPGHGLAEPFDYRGVDLLEHVARSSVTSSTRSTSQRSTSQPIRSAASGRPPSRWTSPSAYRDSCSSGPPSGWRATLHSCFA
jgi:pimeloyl-ACP methyl ester carboxylesterase